MTAIRWRWRVAARAFLLSLAVALAALGAAHAAAKGQSPFAIRGIKGLWWDGIEKYQKALPWMADHDMNFLMLCYTAFPASGQDWRADYTPEQLKQIGDLAAEGRRRGVTVCLSFNPGIWSKPPLSYSSEADYQLALNKVKAIHAVGVRSFALCLDDINKAMRPEDQKAFGSLQAAQIHFVNRLWIDMKAMKPRPRLIFCPSAYTTGEAKAHLDYTKAIGAGIDRDVMLFWTGPDVCSASITAADAREIGALFQRKPFVWDNYPVNDMFPWRPMVGPVKNRGKDLAGAVSGYLANPMKQWYASRLPLATLAAYFEDPARYDPRKAIADAVAEYPADQRPALRLLVELYGRSFWGEPAFPPKPEPKDAAQARALLPQYILLRRDLSTNPRLAGLWADVQPTLDADIAAIEKAAA
jgi:hyaluronoglucosaminidase